MNITSEFPTTSQHRLLFVALLLTILSTIFSSVTSEAGPVPDTVDTAVANNRYGGPVKRPPVFNPGFSRPNTHFPSMLIPSPSHAYSILARPHNVQRPQQILPPRYQQQQQQQQQLQQPPQLQQPQQQLHHRPIQNQGIRLQGPPKPQLLQQQQQQQYNPIFTNNYNPPITSSNNYQQIHYQPPQQQQQQQSTQNVYYPEIMTNYVPAAANQYHTVYRPSQPLHSSVSYHQPTPQYVMHGGSSSNWLNYVHQQQQQPQLSSSNQQIHYHLHKQPLAAAASSPSTQQLISYEPCSSSGWSPILSAGSVVPAAAASSIVQPNYLAASSVSSINRPIGQTSFRYQPDSSNKVVVLSHEVLKTLLANSNKNNQLTKNTNTGSKGTVDSVATAASSSNSVIVTSSGNSIEKASGEPSVKLVGYIGPTSDSTPTGYIQVPVNKQILESLSASNMNGYDMSSNNSNQYSLFTMKSVNDVQSLLGAIKSSVPDQDTSASQTIPLGLVVSADGKPTKQDNAASPSNTIFYPSGSSSSSSGGNSPSIQMVGHVQVTSPDVSSQFTKREGDSQAILSRSSADDKSDDLVQAAPAPAPAPTAQSESKPAQ